MSECMNRDEVDSLRDELRIYKDYIAELETRCKDLSEELRKANLALENNRYSVNEEELSYRDGMIAGLKYAIRCNGVSGGEIN